ncbi:class I SAM-dependent methyltransferase [Maritimibacter sp. UBA3975]|uniref:class I SAM-dependent methyltransferase n=1 Tax=Maritimibacter sp. UBA3975 TaxID=1946833 RepID=UPI0025BA8B43|nr:class I SAM-dependent methyltransferase [Maritimibacter sp. UBA3975]|tara:strand:+ start:11799 stop:12386 length:588 start_codon:yes stop_codon:yes gene_type:complete
MLNGGERQVAPTIAGIRRDHVARYEFAATQLRPRSRVLDLACGVGYGSAILAEAHHNVTGIDQSAAAINYAIQHYWRPGALFMTQRAEDLDMQGRYDVAVSFETVEHIEYPLPVLRKLRTMADKLIVSVPNEAEFPHTTNRFHFRHYTKDDLDTLLADAGWSVEGWFGQAGPHSDVTRGARGRTIIAIANHEVKE